MQTTVQTFRTSLFACRPACATIAIGVLLTLGIAQSGLAQAGTNPLGLFKNYFVTGDYVVAGWVEGAPDGSGFAPGTISIPDTLQPSQNGVPATVPKGADIVAAYLYWGTVEKSKTAFAGQKAFFNGYSITGTILGNLNAPVSWSSGGCAGSSKGTTTMRTYRADVRPYMPVDLDPSSPTFGTLLANGTFLVRLGDSGSNGNTQPNALGASLVVIYRILNPPTPLNAIVLYDGSYAPSNTAQNTSQTMVGFYQPSTNPVAKLTHIVGNGQINKSEQVYLNGLNSTSQPLPSLYGTLPPFPGVYGTWDNPTWLLNQYGYVQSTDTSETTSVAPSSSNSGCVSWGAMVLSTTVQDTDGDGLLDVWEQGSNPGYTDAVSGNFVALPGANPITKDIFVEVDYLTKLDGSLDQHSHLPKREALDAVGSAYSAQGINVHFDLGSNIYPGDPYVIPGGTGGQAISESAVLCTDAPPALCAFPNQPAVGWKGGFESFQNDPTLGNFQPGRGHSYHYVLFGHSLGAPRSFWSTFGNALSDPTVPQLVKIVNSGTTATVTIQTPQIPPLPPTVTLYPKPGDCPNALIPACSDANNSRVTVTGALGQPNLNGTYSFSNVSSSTSVINNVTVATTTFTVTTASVASGTYTFTNEPQLAVAYLGPTSTSGHSDFGGGGDSAVTLGLWGADDPAGCQPDPSVALASGQVYCSNQVGTTNVQTGTLLHELGHTLTLTHGGAYYNDPLKPSLPTYELNCKPNFPSVMSYLFQVRGFVDGGFDYSGQTLAPLNEAFPFLSESAGVGVDIFTGLPSTHLTRWYSAPNALDTKQQNTIGGRYATAHCDGTPLTSTDVPAVRVDGTVALGGTFSAPLDFNNDLIFPDSIVTPGVDANYNGILSTAPITGDSPFSGFNDWQIVNPASASNGVALQQMSARANAFESSAGGGIKTQGGGIKTQGGGIDDDGGGIKTWGGGIKTQGGGIKTQGGGIKTQGGGTDQDEDTACSTVDPPTGLTAVLSGHNVVLNWSPPGGCQIRRYDIWRATGFFPTPASVFANFAQFSTCPTCKVTGTPPLTTFTDTNVKNNTTYTYFVTDKNKQGAQSGPSGPATIFVKF
jgi:hypothetical protein